MRLSRENEQDSGTRPLALFVDANTIVSGLVFEGNEALLLRLGRIGLCSLMTTSYVMDEVTRVLRAEEFRLSDKEIASLLSYADRCITVHGSPRRSQLRKYSSLLNDKKDVHVLAGFHDSKCDMLVSGDKELLRKVGKAVTTRQVLEILLSEQ